MTRLVGLWSSRSWAIVAVSKDGRGLSSTLFGCLCNVTKSLKEPVYSWLYVSQV